MKTTAILLTAGVAAFLCQDALSQTANSPPVPDPNPVVNSEVMERAVRLLREKVAEREGTPMPVTALAAVAPAQNTAVRPAPPAPGSPPTVDPQVMEHAVRLLREKVAELEGTPIPAESTLAAVEPAQNAAIQPAPPEPQSPTAVDPEVMERAVRILREKVAEMESQPASVNTANISVFATQPSASPQVAFPASETSSSPGVVETSSQPSPSGVIQSGNLLKSKQQQLSELLQLYKADVITPKEYHERRAKIVWDQP